MSLVSVNGVRLNVEVEGRGPPVVALHGFTGSVATWEAFTAAASRDYMVVRVDLLGHGASDAPESPERYRMERCVEDLAALLDRLGLARATWLGYSLGGRVAISAAVGLPERTAALIAESASPGLARLRREGRDRVAQDERLARWIEEVGIEEFVAHWEALPLFASQASLPAASSERLRAQRLRNRPVGLANSLRGMGSGAQPPLHRRLPELAMPALFIAGAEDSKFVAIAREMHRAVPGSRLDVIPGAGHAAHLERPDDFNQAVLGFLTELREEGRLTGAGAPARTPESP